MKKCPECDTQNPDTNLFCPVCGYSFLDEKGSEIGKTGRKKGDNRRLAVGLAVTVVLLVGLTAGLISFIAVREIERSRLVPVETGVIWKCSECGEVYRERITTVYVRKEDADEYEVETVEGTCYLCRYGPEVERLQTLLETISLRTGADLNTVEIEPAAAEFINENPGLFPADGPSGLEGTVAEVDPRQVIADFGDFAGGPVHIRGEVVAVESLEAGDGTEMTYLQLEPEYEGQQEQLDYFVLYPASCSLLAGDTAEAYLLPADLVMYRSGEQDLQSVMTIGMYIEKVD